MKKTYTYIVHHEDGNTHEITMDRKAALSELQAAVKGMIEPVRLGPGRYGYVNEEGLMNDMEPNRNFPLFVGPVVELPKGCRV